MVPRGRKTVTVDVVCRLHNDGEHHYVTSAAAGEEAHFWHLLNSRQREVQRSKPGKEAEHHKCHMVASGASSAFPEQVVLYASKLRHGQTYTLRFRLMGHSAEADFTVFRPRERKAARKRARKRVAKKRPTKKKAAKKKTAKKKAAKKKATKKKATKKKATKKKTGN